MLQYNLTCLHSRLKLPRSKSLTQSISNQPLLLYSPFLMFSFGSFIGPTAFVLFLLTPKPPSVSTMLTELATNPWGKDIIHSLLLLGALPSTSTQRDPPNTRKGWRKGPDPFLLEPSQHWHICQQTTESLSAPDLHILSSCSQPPASHLGINQENSKIPAHYIF